jgi:hypothetical protein
MDKLTLVESIRRNLNRYLGQIAASRSRKKAFHSRTLLVADHWDGSVQQFYHFFFGYYMPLCEWLIANPRQPLTVRDCGPMNIWFDRLRPRYDIEIVPPGAALHMVVGKRLQYEVLKGLDDPRLFDAEKISNGATAIARALGIDGFDEGGTHVTVIDRASSEDFYHLPESETHMSGRERRWVPNLNEIQGSFGGATTLVIKDFAGMEPEDQISLVSRSSVLVGQHGAGLAHMVWMPKNSIVIEIAPPLPPQVERLFETLAQTLGLNYRRIPQEHAHAPIDVNELAGILLEAERSAS